MYLSDAYPSPAISAGAMTAIAVVMVGVLAFWLVMVYVADRQGGKQSTRKADNHLKSLAEPDEAAKDKHSEPGTAPADRRHGAAA